MEASSALDPPEQDNPIEIRPLVRGSDAPGQRNSRVGGSGTGKTARSSHVQKTIASAMEGSGIWKWPIPLPVLHIHHSLSPQRKKGLLLLLSALFLSLLVMLMAKRGAVGIEKQVKVGEQETVVHLDVDPHHTVDHSMPKTAPVDEQLTETEKQNVKNAPSSGSTDKLSGATTKQTEEDSIEKESGSGVEDNDKTHGEKPGSTESSVVELPPEQDGAKSDADESEILPSTTIEDESSSTKNEITASSDPKNMETSYDIKPKTITIDTEGYQPTEMISPSFFLPGTENAPRGSAAGGGFDYPLTNHFQFHNYDASTASTWGFFDFEDPNPQWRGKIRPFPDFESIPNRDVKGSDFPDGAWQTDGEYMKRFLTEAKKLVNRTMEAIYAEYGVGVPNGDLSKLSDEQLVQREEFAPYTIIQNIEDDTEFNARGSKMWTTQGSLDGLARRLIHAIITQDTFHVVLGGHSAAAGHGNGFNQSYIIQAGHVLEPVFAHLGVTMRAFNFAQGGMGTLQQAMAGMDLRGKETDMIMWDSGMTERSQEYFVFFMKQALISGNRAPYLIGSGNNMREFHLVAGANIGEHGTGWDGPVTLSEAQALEIPWAARYLTCPRGEGDICKKHEYEGNGCWVDRDDFTPPTPQDHQPGGQASWHPGNRIHKIRGRRIALLVLRGLEYALQKWDDLTAETGHPLSDEHWHVTKYYESIKEKAPLVPGCPDLKLQRIGQTRRRHLRGLRLKNESQRALETETDEYWPWRICNLPLHGKSLWGPRHNPMETSLLTLLKPNSMGDIDPTTNNAYLWPPIYYPPEMIGPWNVPPPEDINVELIAGGRRLVMSNTTRSLDNDEDAIVPGLGFDVQWGRPGYCDGTSHSWCDKTEESSCLMGGTQDSRGMICFNGLSGWVIFDVKNVKHGFIGARIQAWHENSGNKVTKGWTELNNGGKGNYDKSDGERKLYEQDQKRLIFQEIDRMNAEIERDILQDPTRRHLKGGQSCGIAQDYIFEWAINGEIVSWDYNKFCDQYTRLAYNLDVIRFMDDATKTGDFELAMRLKNTGSRVEMCITHLYWA